MKSAAAPLAILEAPPPNRRARVRVLIVDRDSTGRSEMERWLLDDARVDVEAFATAEEALTMSSGDSYDLCLLDYALDGVDGVMLGAMIRALNPGARLVLTSDAVSSPLVRKAVEHGFQAVLAKPVEPAELAKLLVGAAR